RRCRPERACRRRTERHPAGVARRPALLPREYDGGDVRWTPRRPTRAYRHAVVASTDQALHSPPAWFPSRARDVLTAVIIAVIQVAGTFGAAHQHEGRSFQGLDAVAIVLLLAGPVALLLRRRAPAAVLVFVLGVTLVY